MFEATVNKILEDFNVYPRAQAPVINGPNIDFRGSTPAGFLGGGLPGINPSASKLYKIKKKKKLTRKSRIST